jgi:nitrogen fixation protein FixH
VTAPAQESKPPFTIKGWHVGAAVTAFFTLIIGVDATFLTLAYRSHPGQVAVRPYEDGLVYNAELARLRAQERLGWRAGVEARPGAVVVVMRDREGRPLTGMTVSAVLQRPATEQGRAVVLLTEVAPGEYSGSRALSGVWDTRVEASDAAGQDFAASRRLTWP